MAEMERNTILEIRSALSDIVTVQKMILRSCCDVVLEKAAEGYIEGIERAIQCIKIPPKD